MLGFCYVVFVAEGACDDVEHISGEDGYGDEGGEGCVCVWDVDEFPIPVMMTVFGLNGGIVKCKFRCGDWRLLFFL